MASLPPAPGPEVGSKTAQKQAVDPYATLGQLSIAPATQTTVVTTTTTTTTSYPPMIMNAPRSLKERDSKEYPLAHAPLPESIKKITFPAGDFQACFEEADDTVEKMNEVRSEVMVKQANHMHAPSP
jgi:F-box and WD-40 domain protein CDC4